MAENYQTIVKTLAAPIARWLARSAGVSVVGDIAAGAMEVAAKGLDAAEAVKTPAQRFHELASQLVRREAAQYDLDGYDITTPTVVTALDAALKPLADLPDTLIKLNLGRDALLEIALKSGEPHRPLVPAEREIYEDTLPRLIDAVIALIPELPGFSGQVAAETLSRLDVLIAGQRALADQVGRQVGDPKSWEPRYLAHAARFHNHMELFGSDIDRKAKKLDLTRAYVGLSVSEGVASNNGGDEEDTRSVTADELLMELATLRQGKAGRALVLGAAGTGKTTLLRWAAVRAASSMPESLELARRDFLKLAHEITNRAQKDSHEESVWGDWRDLIPFVIRLRDTGAVPPLTEWANDCAKQEGMSPPPRWVGDVLDAGHGLVMIDGVDEIAAFDREQCAADIGELAARYPRSVFVVTSRPAAVEPGWLADHGFTEAEVRPLALVDQDALIGKWFDAAGPRDGVATETMAEDLREKLRQNPRLAMLATNPLMLAMLCALFYRVPDSAPTGPYELVERLISMMLHERDRERKIDGSDPLWLSMSESEKTLLLMDVAYSMVVNGGAGGGSTLLVDTLDTVIAKTMRGFGKPLDAIVDFRRVLMERSGVLQAASNDRVQFLHNTFKEFLAARVIAGNRDIDMLVEHADDREWWPLIRFAVSGKDGDFPEKLIGRLLDMSGLSAKRRRERQYLTYACGHFALWKSDALLDQLAALEKELLPPRNAAEAELAALGGEPVAKRLLSLKPTKFKASERVAVVRAFKHIDAKKAADWGRVFVRDKAMSVWEELAELIGLDEADVVWRRLTNGGKVSGALRRLITDVSAIKAYGDVYYLDLDGTGVADLSPLSGLTSLQMLSLDGTGVTDLSPLSGLTSLCSLSLNGTGVTDLSPLSGLTSLQTLRLDGTGVVDLSPLSDLTSLKTLWLDRADVSDLSPLSGLTSLQELWLEGTGVTDVSPLSGLTSLQTLSLGRTGIIDLSPLSGIVSVQVLFLNETGVTDLSPLSGLTSLLRLELEETGVTDVSPLSGLTSLRLLWLNGTGVTDLSPLDHLRGTCEIHGR